MVESTIKMQLPEILTGMVLKLSGASAGTLLSFLFMPPVNRREALRRGLASLIIGIVFAVNAKEYLHFSDSEWSLISASCLCALAAWWAIGAFVRVVVSFIDAKKRLEP